MFLDPTESVSLLWNPSKVCTLCRLAVLGLVVVAAWVSMVWLLVFTVKEARRQKLAIKRRQEAAREGGTALALARELQDK